MTRYLQVVAQKRVEIGVQIVQYHEEVSFVNGIENVISIIHRSKAQLK